MSGEESRRALTLQVNPQSTVEAARQATGEALGDRLRSLEVAERVSELRSIGDAVVREALLLSTDESLDAVERSAVSSLVEHLDKSVNRLETQRVTRR